MSRLVDSAVRRWRDGAALRAEHELEPTLRRRIDRIPQRLHDRRALRAERRLRSHMDIGEAVSRAQGEAWSRDGFFTR
jgi:hypothetical protein